MSYRLAVCDDNKEHSDSLLKYVQKWSEESNVSLNTAVFSSAEELLFRSEEADIFDIYLLDIEMNGMNGVELAKCIRKKSKEAQIIFVTGYSDYISDGYDVEALNYLMKPINERKLFQVLSKAVSRVDESCRRLVLDTSDGIAAVPFYDIRYIEVRSNYITVHAEADYTCKMTLKCIEEKLDSRFFKLGRSYLINLSHLRKSTKTDAFLSDGTMIPIPRGYYDALHRAFINHYEV